MPKKKHRKKARSGKRAEHHKIAKHAAHAKRTKGSKHGGHHSQHSKPEHRSFPLLRAIKRRRAAQNGEHLELDGRRGSGHHAHKKTGKGHQAHKSANHHHGEPVITEKSFENMLAYRRFQNHVR